MKAIVLTTLAILGAEAVFCSVLLVRRINQPFPALPAGIWDDPLVAEELAALAAQARESGSSTDWQALAEALLGQGRYRYAAANFREAVRRDANNYDAQFGLAFCIGRIGHTQESTREFQKLNDAINGKPSQSSLWHRSLYEIGLNALREEDIEQAEAVFRRDRAIPAAEFQLAKLLVRSDRVDEALPIIETNLERRPQSLHFLFLKYQAMQALGRDDQAFQAADRLERSARFFPIHLGTTYITPFHKRLGIEKILTEYNNLISLNNMNSLQKKLDEISAVVEDLHLPSVRIALVGQMEIALQQHDAEQIHAALRQLDAFGIQNAETLQFAGAADRMTGDVQAAISKWERAAEMSPNVQLYLHLAEAYEELGDAARRDQALAKSLLHQGLTLYRSDRVSDAKDMFQKSLEQNDDDARTWFYLGECRRLAGDDERAREAYQSCLQKNPNHGRALSRLERLETSSEAR